jgi:hypothetical protein
LLELEEEGELDWDTVELARENWRADLPAPTQRPISQMWESTFSTLSLRSRIEVEC